MDYELRIEKRAHRLPEAWDRLAGDNPYLKRDFLSFIEGTEADYRPRYYMLYDRCGELDSYFVAHRRGTITWACFPRSTCLLPLPY